MESSGEIVTGRSSGRLDSSSSVMGISSEAGRKSADDEKSDRLSSMGATEGKLSPLEKMANVCAA